MENSRIGHTNQRYTAIQSMFCRYCNEIRSATLTRSVTIRKPKCKTVYHRAWWRWCANSQPWCRERDEEWPRSCSNATEDPVIVLKYMVWDPLIHSLVARTVLDNGIKERISEIQRQRGEPISAWKYYRASIFPNGDPGAAEVQRRR